MGQYGSKAGFVDKYAQLLGGGDQGKKQAAATYDKAQSNQSAAMEMALRLLPGFIINTTVTPKLQFIDGAAVSTRGPISPLPNREEPNPSVRVPAELATLFGAMETCECEHCASVYSPSAYFLDIMQFLRAASPEAYAELKRRRPDLEHIALNCENALPPLPYIDLVNEILEWKTLPLAPPISNQTIGKAIALAVQPEYIHVEAYAQLKDKVYPFTLPYDDDLFAMRVYLRHLGIDRTQLLKMFGQSPIKVTLERLGLSFSAAAIILGKDLLNNSQQSLDSMESITDSSLHFYYGYSKAADENVVYKFSQEQMLGTEPLSGSVQYFIGVAGITYLELLALLNCRFIQEIPDTAKIEISSRISTAVDTCKLDELYLKGLTWAHLHRIHRFLRLWRCLGCSMYELDHLLLISSSTGLRNENDLHQLAEVFHLWQQSGMPITHLSVLWRDMDTYHYKDHLKAGQPDIPSVYEELFLDKSLFQQFAPAFIMPISGFLRQEGNYSHLNVLCAAFQVSEEAIQQIILEQWPNTANDVELNLVNLSEIYRIVLLSKWLGIQPIHLFKLRAICQIPAPFSSPYQTRLFIERINLFRANGLSIEDLSYLFLPVAISDLTENIRIAKDLQKILREIWPSTLEDSPEISLALNNAIWNYFSGIFNASLSTIKLILPILPPGGLSDLFKIPIFSERPFIDLDLTSEEVPTDSSWLLKYREIEKLLFWVEKMRLDSESLAWIMIFDSRFSALWTVREPAGQLLEFYLIEMWLQLLSSRKYLKDAARWPEIMSVIELRGENQISLLSRATGWNEQTLDQWAKIFDLQSLVSEQRLREIPGYIERLANGMDLSSRTGISPSDLKHAIDPIDSNVARLKQAIRSKYTEAQWLKVARPLEDTLREQRRDALLAHLIYRNSTGDQWANANELYEYLLIDVEMSACMMTSRIKQAISSVQLFINRLLMNLEYGVNDQRLQLGTEQAKEWNKWRKWYRIWEANRKIFLYPENWIEPELRDDKSSIFKECEDKLLQNELTDELAEETVKHYLEQLDKVARLQIITLFHEKDNPDYAGGVLHVFGRTYASPHEYYYRRCLMNTSIPGDWRWTTWEKVELDIQGDSLTAAVWNGRLFLFWPIFSVKSEEEPITMVAPGDTMATSKKYLEVKLAWSEKKNNKWGLKKLSAQPLKFFGDQKDEIFKNSSTILLPQTSEETFIKYIEKSYLRIVAFEGSYKLFFADSIKIYSKVQLDDGTVIINPGTRLKISSQNYLGGFEGNNDLNSFEPFNSYLFQQGTNYRLASSKYRNRNYDNRLDRKGSFLSQVPGSDGELHDSFSLSFDNPFLSKSSLTRVFSSSPKGLFSIICQEIDKYDAFDEAFFYQDSENTLFIPSSRQIETEVYQGAIGASVRISSKKDKYKFYVHYQPYLAKFIRTSISELFTRKTQVQLDVLHFDTYQPNPEKINSPYPVGKVEFEVSGAYSHYNWELFFHLPILIACRLSTDQKFEKARKWFHCVFDPTTAEQGGKERFWQFLPFFEEAKTQSRNLQEYINDVNGQIAEWERNPFNPHAIARLRTVAYMKFVVMRYIDNLIEWGDALFRRDTIESINEATHLYIQAAKILGTKPELVPQRATPETATVKSSNTANSSTWNIQVAIEAFISPNAAPAFSGDALNMYNFCIPKNDQLLAYWDQVANRLFKIRHCMNIEGIIRQLPLFEPPIDPGLLVRAAAAGISINEVLSDLDGANLPLYRFNLMLQKAKELCGEVKVLGSALLSAIEKKDGETLSLLRSRHEMKMMELVGKIKERQVEEAKEVLNSLVASQENTQIRIQAYSQLKTMNSTEVQQLVYMGLAGALKVSEGLQMSFATAAYTVPNMKIGSPTTTGIEVGGKQFGDAAVSAAHALGAIASFLDSTAQITGLVGSHERRADEYELQIKLAENEFRQIEKQILAAQIRLAIAQKELSNHEQQIEHTREIDDFLKGKFTNQELYQKMVNQLSTLFFQTYNIAFDLARKAEKCFEHELGVPPDIIKYDHRSGLKQGLLAGEKLAFDLSRLDVAYLDQNRRELELTKHISLNQLNPLALLQLREAGKCDFAIPEELFDLDFPGHYMRRIKSVSITIPCVAGPYTSINATLRLKKNSTRVKASSGEYPRKPEEEDNRFRDNFAGIQSIATSSAQNDSGLFELNFRDERYLPFEGTGAISEWTLEMMETKELRQFDYNTIADVVVHLRYTAREDGGLKTAAITHLKGLTDALGGVALQRLFSLRHDFPNEWHRHAQDTSNVLTIQLAKHHFPYWVQMGDVTITGFELHKNGVKSSAEATGGTISDSATVALSIPLDSSELAELRDAWLIVNYSKAVIN